MGVVCIHKARRKKIEEFAIHHIYKMEIDYKKVQINNDNSFQRCAF